MPIPQKKEPLSRPSAKERVYNVLRDWIIDGTLQPNEKLYDNELAKYFSVSRTPVREALQMLDAQKLIQVVPGKTTIVTKVDPQNVREWYLPLISLNILAAEIVTNQINEEELAHLTNINNELIDAIECNSAKETLQLDKDFHRQIVLLTRNQYIIEFTDILNLQLRRTDTLFYKQSAYHLLFAREHENLLKCFRERDVLGATENVKKNQLHTLKLMEEFFSKQLIS